MKKFMSITLTALMLVSVSACSRNNSARRGNMNNYGVSQGQNNVGRVGYQTTAYRDGTYTGRGNIHGNVNEVATVDIRNGRIVNIVLDQVDASGRIINFDGRNTSGTTGTGTGTTNYGTGTGANYGTGAGTNYNTGTNVPSGMGGVTGNNTGSSTGNTTGTTGRSTTANDIMNSGIIGPTGMTGGITANYGTENNYGTSGNSGTGSGFGTSGSYGNYGTGSGNGTGTANLSTMKRDLANSMIQAQSTNIITNYSDYNDSISNWKVAVQRALDQARR